MSKSTIFYSWQLDTDCKLNKFLIRDSIKCAIDEIDPTSEIVAPLRLDHDTKDRSGTPEISQTLFEKIKSSTLFVADVTLTSRARAEEAKCSPNPNVLLELGYAASCIGWSRIILVMNTDHGDPDEQIFDLKNRRWPLVYNTFEGDERRDIKACKIALSNKFKDAFKLASRSGHASVDRLTGQLDHVMLSILIESGEADWFFMKPRQNTQEQLTYLLHDIAVSRMLSMGLIHCEISVGQGYRYWWTSLGKLIAEKVNSPRNGNQQDLFGLARYAE